MVITKSCVGGRERNRAGRRRERKREREGRKEEWGACSLDIYEKAVPPWGERGL